MSGEKRPEIWIGHATMHTPRLEESEAFMKDVGMRSVFRGDEVAVLELRGGTHLVLIADANAVPAEADFDLMVEDLDDTYADFRARNYELTDVTRGQIHDSFEVVEPGGNRITFNSTHVADHDLV